jgi:acyl-coenzyme A thioesterase PaaI-like protein
MSALCHPACIACRPTVAGGLGLDFVTLDDGSVEAVFDGGDACQGYTGFLHGPVIAMLLDAAMTNCLFALGRCGVTGELTIRFRHPVAGGEASRLKAWIERATPPLLRLRSELWQVGQLRAAGIGKFMERRDMDPLSTMMR